jgi:hypothetical protein
VDEVTARTAYFPDSIVGLRPDFFEMAYERSRQIPAVIDMEQSFVPRQIGGIEKLALNIELKLL